MNTFHNFALKIETSCSKRVIEPILETRNAKMRLAGMRMVYAF